ncbi:hypothetical protein RvY_07141 [Ramazzottius varieornatus]|uniref:RIIa domain-containing protein n=1 Tax=Ramazzottius varieornatus TaxID=947166 RepID=A0A1D1V3Q2_RAMVA|nr:hypothetical protein RvY_07141 [Ramazzottius varieornatus]
MASASGESQDRVEVPLDDDPHDTELTYPTQAGQTKGPRQTDRSRVTLAPKIYASAYSDEVWIMLKEYTKEVLRTSPRDILAFSAEYAHSSPIT